MRHLQGLSEAEVAAAMGCRESTVATRLARGLEKLRAILARRGMAVGSAALLGALSTAAAQTAPAALGTSIQAACLGHAAASAGVIELTQVTLKTMLWMKLKTAAAVVAAVGAVGAVGIAAAVGRDAPQAVKKTTPSARRAVAVYHLSPKGDDGASGASAGDAWATFARAFRALSPGDTLVLADGVYRQSILPKRSGEPGRPITIRAQNDGGAVIDG